MKIRLSKDFIVKKQKDCETVLEFYYKLSNDADKIFDNELKKKRNILKEKKLFFGMG